MIALFSLFVVLVLSVIITRIATISLVKTGLSEEASRFQARSAFTGVGFTTNESEAITGHPVRRRILAALMLLGNVGVVGAISTLVLTFAGLEQDRDWAPRALWLVGGLFVIWLGARSRWIAGVLSRVIGWALDRWTELDVRDYVGLLRLSSDYRVRELKVGEDDWVAGRTLEELGLNDEGILVLGLTRVNDRYVGAPQGETEVRAGDILVLYGRSDAISALGERGPGVLGDRAHDSAVERHKDVVREQEAAETEDREREEEERRRRQEQKAVDGDGDSGSDTAADGA